MKPRLLDLFCGAGGCSVGYATVGFDVVGVDIRKQPHYPFEFYQMDALEFCQQHGKAFDVIHASPPCQMYSRAKSLTTSHYPMLVDETRRILRKTHLPYIIENVVGAPLINPIMLCGTMFGLGVLRHRLFECYPEFFVLTLCCNHNGKTTASAKTTLQRRGVTRTPKLSDGFQYVCVFGNDYLKEEGAKAMGINWMSKAELSQAIPPKYTEYLGREMLKRLNFRALHVV